MGYVCGVACRAVVGLGLFSVPIKISEAEYPTGLRGWSEYLLGLR